MVDGPGFNRVDVGIFRNFNLVHGVTFTLRGEGFNVLNHVNWGSVGTSATSSHVWQGHVDARPAHPAGCRQAQLLTQNKGTAPALSGRRRFYLSGAGSAAIWSGPRLVRLPDWRKCQPIANQCRISRFGCRFSPEEVEVLPQPGCEGKIAGLQKI